MSMFEVTVLHWNPMGVMDWTGPTFLCTWALLVSFVRDLYIALGWFSRVTASLGLLLVPLLYLDNDTPCCMARWPFFFETLSCY